MNRIYIGVWLGRQVRALREQKRLAQGELATAAGLPQELVATLEQGASDDLFVSELLGLAHGLKVRPATLLPARLPRP